MDLKQLQYFVAAADEGSISGAARRLFITQPPVSVQIQQLEKELGGPLVIRGGRRLELTPAGHELYRHATLLLALSRVAAEDVRAVQSGQHGVLRLGVVSSVGCAMAADWLADFCREQPDIDCELTEANTYELLEKLRAHVIDLCIARRPFPDEGYASVLLQSEELMQFASPAFPISNGWGTLSDQPLITYRRWESILRRQIEDRALTLRLRCLCDDAHGHQHVRAGYGRLRGSGLGAGPAAPHRYARSSLARQYAAQRNYADLPAWPAPLRGRHAV